MARKGKVELVETRMQNCAKHVLCLILCVVGNKFLLLDSHLENLVYYFDI